MVLKLNKRMTGMKKLKEVELLKKLQHPNILRYEYVWYTDRIASLLTYPYPIRKYLIKARKTMVLCICPACVLL